MPLFDTHAHLMIDAFAEDYDDVLARTLEKTGAVLNVGCHYDWAEKAVAEAKAQPSFFAAVGLHPSDAKDFTAEGWERLEALAQEPEVRAIGETGLDYHWDTATPEEQKALFVRHIDLAKRLQKPLVIHDREAHRDTMDVLWAQGAEEVGGVFHAYSGSVEMAQELFRHNFILGVGGVVTFKNAKTLKKVVAEVPLENIILETDCPYMTPTPFRGKRNEPAYTTYVAQAIADLKGISYEDVVDTSWQTACAFFKLDPQSLQPLS